MTAGLAEIRAALAAQIEAAGTGLRVSTYAQGSISPPAAVVLPAQGTFIDYDVTFEPGVANYVMRVVLLVSEGSDRAATELLDSYLEPASPVSIRAIIEADPTLGGVVDWANAKAAQRYGMLEWAGLQYLAAEVLVEIGGAP